PRSACPAAKLSSTETSNIKKLLHVLEVGRETVVGQAVEEYLAVPLLRNSIVQQNEDAAVGPAADQPAEALLQCDGRLRDLVIVERIAARFLHVADARFDYGIAGGREREAIDYHAAQLIAGDVHSLPEG